MACVKFGETCVTKRWLHFLHILRTFIISLFAYLRQIINHLNVFEDIILILL